MKILSIFPIGIFSGKISEFPPVTIESPCFKDANLGTSISCAKPTFRPSQIKDPK